MFTMKERNSLPRIMIYYIQTLSYEFMILKKRSNRQKLLQV